MTMREKYEEYIRRQKEIESALIADYGPIRRGIIAYTPDIT